jgi:hypothetical protein
MMTALLRVGRQGTSVLANIRVHGLWLLAASAFAVGMWSVPSDAAPADDPRAYCRRFESDWEQRLCVDTEEASRQRVLRARLGDVEPKVWDACFNAFESWGGVETCVDRAKGSVYAWSLWSFGGEATSGGLFLYRKWELIASGFESPATCVEGIADALRGLSPSTLQIDRQPREDDVSTPIEREGPRDRFLAIFEDGSILAWTFHCMRPGPFPGAQAP